MCKINGKKLGELRTNLGVSQKKLATELGVTPATISHYELGITQPTEDTLDRICFILNINRNEVEVHDVGFNFLVGESKTVGHERRRMKRLGVSRFANPKEIEGLISSKRTKNETDESKEVNSALQNSFGIGSKRYILIDPSLIHIPEWQRDTDMAKVKEISDNFNETKFDPIKAYVFNGKLRVADGAHRVVAFVLNGKSKILVEILNCEEHEAIMAFLGQSSARKTMTISDMYRAAIKANIEEYIDFKNFFEEKHIRITADDCDIRNSIGSVRPSKTLMRMLNSNRELLEKSIDLIHKLEWDGSEKNAYTVRNMQVLSKLYTHFDNVEELLMNKCKGVSYYEGKVMPIYTNAKLFDTLSAEISR